MPINGNGPCWHQEPSPFLVAIPTEKGGMTLMTVRLPAPDGNPDRDKSGLSGSFSRRALLSLRAAVILAGGLVAGIATGILTFLVVHNLAEAVLAALPACAGAIKFLDALID